LLAFLACLLLGNGTLYAEEPAAPLMSPADVLSRVAARDPTLVVLDVRSAAEYADGHVPGARNVPHDEIATRLPELGELRDRDLVVYCKSGRRAGLALDALGKAGFTRLWHLEGDMQAWTAAGRPVERPASPEPEPKPKP
jgi:rhodanese-related sulfurtransferase